MKKKMQTDTHQTINAQGGGRAIDLACKKSYLYCFGSSCGKVTDVFEREKCNAQEMVKT